MNGRDDERTGLTAAAIFLGYKTGMIGARPTDSAGLRSQPLTSNPPARPLLDSAISPDGKYLAYVDSSGFYLQVIGAGETHRLEMPTGLRGASVSWFPDGARLVLGAFEGDGAASSLWLASILGGEAKKLKDDAGAAMAVRADMTIQEKGLSVLDNDITVLEVCLAVTQRLYFCPGEDHARFKGFLYKIIMKCFSVLGDDLHSCIIPCSSSL